MFHENDFLRSWKTVSFCFCFSKAMKNGFFQYQILLNQYQILMNLYYQTLLNLYQILMNYRRGKNLLLKQKFAHVVHFGYSRA